MFVQSTRPCAVGLAKSCRKTRSASRNDGLARRGGETIEEVMVMCLLIRACLKAEKRVGAIARRQAGYQYLIGCTAELDGS